MFTRFLGLTLLSATFSISSFAQEAVSPQELIQAVKGGRLNDVKAEIERGANPLQPINKYESLNLLDEKYYKAGLEEMPALFVAVRSNQPEVLSYLLSVARTLPQAHFDGESLASWFHLDIGFRNESDTEKSKRMLSVLINEAHVDVNEPTNRFLLNDTHPSLLQSTLLIRAATDMVRKNRKSYNGDNEVVKFLLTQGASPNLMHPIEAVTRGLQTTTVDEIDNSNEILQTLLAAGARPTIQSLSNIYRAMQFNVDKDELMTELKKSQQFLLNKVMENKEQCLQDKEAKSVAQQLMRLKELHPDSMFRTSHEKAALKQIDALETDLEELSCLSLVVGMGPYSELTEIPQSKQLK